MAEHTRQTIRYLTASDGVRLAWAESGTGTPFVKASNWLTHLEYDLESPVWRHWVRFLADHFHFIRYDERGCGMSDWNVSNLSLDRWVEDLEQVIDAARPAGPVDTARHLAGRWSVHRLRGAAPRARVAADSVRGLRARGSGAGATSIATASTARSSNWRGCGGVTTRRSGRCSPRGSSPAAPTSRCGGSTSCAARRRHPRTRHGCWRRGRKWT